MIHFQRHDDYKSLSGASYQVMVSSERCHLESVLNRVKSEKYFENLLREKLKLIKNVHQDREVVHPLLMSSKAAQLFGQYYRRVKEWTILHEYELAYQDAITLVSKSFFAWQRCSMRYS